MNITEQLPSTVFQDTYRRLAEHEADRIVKQHSATYVARQRAIEAERHQDKVLYS